MKTNKSKRILLKQQGATMITTLVFLLLMTVVTVAASKISILDMLVSSNNLRQMEVFQQTENHLKLLATPVKFFEAYSAHEHGLPWSHAFTQVSTKPNTQEKIESRNLKYQCGGFDGLGISIGSSQSPCFLYDFQVKNSIPNSGVRGKHYRGAGKEFPDNTKNSTLD